MELPSPLVSRPTRPRARTQKRLRVTRAPPATTDEDEDDGEGNVSLAAMEEALLREDAMAMLRQVHCLDVQAIPAPAGGTAKIELGPTLRGEEPAACCAAKAATRSCIARSMSWSSTVSEVRHNNGRLE